MAPLIVRKFHDDITQAMRMGKCEVTGIDLKSRRNGDVYVSIQCEIPAIYVKNLFDTLKDLSDEELQEQPRVRLKISVDSPQGANNFDFDGARLLDVSILRSGMSYGNPYIVVAWAEFGRDFNESTGTYATRTILKGA